MDIEFLMRLSAFIQQSPKSILFAPGYKKKGAWSLMINDINVILEVRENPYPEKLLTYTLYANEWSATFVVSRNNVFNNISRRRDTVKDMLEPYCLKWRTRWREKPGSFYIINQRSEGYERDLVLMRLCGEVPDWVWDQNKTIPVQGYY